MATHWKYAKYVVRHKYFVFIAGLRTGASLWRLLKHDWSKLLPSEWFPYAEYFYGAKPKLQREENDDFQYWTRVQPYLDAFNRAWLFHQRRNDHHWQFWVLRNDDGTTQALPMPDAARKEMLADWMGAGRAITGRWETAEWYAKNREKIILHPDTRAFIEAKLFESQPVSEPK
jgi:hypothetical protein